MVNYADAKIYRIVDNSTGLQYIGSTTQPLAKRLFEHRKNYRTWVNKDRPTGTSSYYMTSFEILEGGNETIEIIEKCDVSSRDELRAREGHWIRELECVNKLVAGRTRQEWLAANREDILAQRKEYYEANKEAISARQKKWKRETVRCEICGSTVTKGNYSTHKKAKYCLEAAAKAAQDDSEL